MEPIEVSTAVKGALEDIVEEAIGAMSIVTSAPFGNAIVICKRPLLASFFLRIFVLTKYSCRYSISGRSTSKEPAGLSGEVREETSTSAIVDVAELDVLYHDLPPY